MGPDPLTIEFHWPRERQPSVADDPSVVPPVVPHLLGIAPPQRKTGNRSLVNTVVDFNRQIICGVEVGRDIQRVGGIASLVSSHLGSIQPDPRRIKRGSEMQFHVKVRGLHRHLKGTEIPGLAHIVVMPADVPGMRQVHRFCLGWNGLLPSGGGANLTWVGAKKPIAIQINRGRGESRSAED